MKSKKSSDIYFDPAFNFSNIPLYIKSKQYEEIIKNTSIGQPRFDNWICIKHYKADLYEDKDALIFDRTTLSSNIKKFIRISDTEVQYVDIVHMFLIIMLHMKKVVEKYKGTNPYYYSFDSS